MAKWRLIICLCLLSFPASALEVDQQELTDFDNSISRCTEFMEPDENFALDDYYEKTAFIEKVQQCHTNLAVKIFEKYYKKDPKKTRADIARFLEDTHKFYSEAYEKSIYCKPNCGLSASVKAQYDTAYALERYLKQTIAFLKTRR